MKPKPVKIFSDEPALNCEFCGRNLLEEGIKGNFIVFKNNDGKFACIKFACKEHDSIVTKKEISQNLNYSGWDDIDDMLIPTIWIKKLMAFMNELYSSRESISNEYFEDVKKLFLNTFPYVTREMSKEELERVSSLLSLDIE